MYELGALFMVKKITRENWFFTEGLTQAEIAEIEGVSRERINQIEKIALAKLERKYPKLFKQLAKDFGCKCENYSPQDSARQLLEKQKAKIQKRAKAKKATTRDKLSPDAGD